MFKKLNKSSVVVVWLLCVLVNYGLIYGGFRSLQVNDWSLSQGSSPKAYRTAYGAAGVVSLAGPLAIGFDFVVQLWAGFPGWHIEDWPTLEEK